MLWRVVVLACLAALCGAQSINNFTATAQSMQNVTIIYGKQGVKENGKSTVTVAVPRIPRAKPPTLHGRFSPLIYFRDYTDQKQLDCKADGIPEVNYEWQMNGVTIVPDPGIVEVAGGVLKLLRPTINHQGYYQCFASNSHGTAVSSFIEIRKANLLGYPTLSIEDKGSFDEGSHVVLTCRDQPESVPTAVYDWYTGKSDAVPTGPRVMTDQFGDLHFINVQVGDQLPDGKTYNCSLYNGVVNLRVYGSATKFKVTPAPVAPRDPSVAWFTIPEKAVALLGQEVKLQCIPDGYPLPRIEWAKQGGVLPRGRSKIIDNKYTLEISNVTENDEGTYICTAVNGNQTSRQTIFVDVKSEPIWVEKLKSLTVTQGKTAKFECVARSAVGETDNVVVHWFQNGKKLKSGQTGKILVSGTELTVSNVLKPYDLMNIQCNVSNSIGYQMADAFLNVIERIILTVPPEPKVTLNPGKVVEMPIAAKADPLYENRLTYSWSKDGQLVSTNLNDPVYVDVANKLVVNATRYIEGTKFQELLGNYTCLVSMGLENGEGDIVVYSYVSSGKGPVIVVQGGLWWIAIIVLVIVLVVIIILIGCYLCRDPGETYLVDKMERRAGHDPVKELADSGFYDVTRAEAPDEKKPYGDPDQVSLANDPPIAGDTDSLDEFGELDFSNFNEDGSFIGNYGASKEREANQSTV